MFTITINALFDRIVWRRKVDDDSSGENSGVTSVRQFSFNSIISIIAIFTAQPTHRFTVPATFFPSFSFTCINFLIHGKIEIWKMLHVVINYYSEFFSCCHLCFSIFHVFHEILILKLYGLREKKELLLKIGTKLSFIDKKIN